MSLIALLKKNASFPMDMESVKLIKTLLSYNMNSPILLAKSSVQW